jgi:hypothetical protein
VYNFNVPTFGKGVVYDVDQKIRTEQFRFFTEALKRDRLKKYVPMFAAEAEVSRIVAEIEAHRTSSSPIRPTICKTNGVVARA